MKLTEQQFFDYITCPAKYDLKYNKNIDIQEQLSNPRLLNKVAKYFYVNLFNGKLPSQQELKNKWDSICKTHLNVITPKSNLEGWGLIINLLNWASRNKITVLDVNTQYSIVFQDVELIGQTEPIIATTKGFELLVSDFHNKLPDTTEIDMKLKHTLDAYAFKKMFNKELNGVHIRMFKLDKDLYTYRSQPDFDRLESSVIGVAKGIAAEAFYPRENPLCSSCTARQYCKYWKK